MRRSFGLFALAGLTLAGLNYGVHTMAQTISLPDNSRQIHIVSQALAQSHGEGWTVNAWGNPKPDYSASTTSGGYGGASSAQKFLVSNNGGGAAHLIYPATFKYGQTYQATLYLRADKPVMVTALLRRDGHNYDGFAAATTQIGTQWTPVTIRGTYQYQDAGGGSVRVFPRTTGTAIYVGSMTLGQIDHNNLSSVAAPKPIPPIFFGITVNKLGVHKNWPGLNTGLLRMWDTTTKWSDVEPSQGQWNFGRADYYVDFATKNGSQILYTFGQTPAWAATATTEKCAYGVGCAPPKDNEDFRLYVRQVAQRYGTKIKYWEVWNEPNFAGFWTGTPEQLVALTKIAQEELKKVNPDAVLIGPCATITGTQFLDRYLAAGGGKYLDGVSFHGYYSTKPEMVADTIDAMYTVMQQHGVSQLPIWNTEGAAYCEDGNPNCAKTITPADLESLSPRALFVMAAKGIVNFDYYNWESRSLASISNLDYQTLTPAGVAYNTATEWLKGSEVFDAYRFGDIFVVRLHNGGTDKTILWTDSDASDVVLPPTWKGANLVALSGTQTPLPASRQLHLTRLPVMLQ